MNQAPHEATFIPFKAAAGQEAAVAALLAGAAALVKKTEPLTLQWLGLQRDSATFAIADFFEEPAGRAAHFAGQVAAALKSAAGAAVAGGWEQGVVAQVENARVLSSTVTADGKNRAKLAVRIELGARPGKEETLAQFLAGAARLVQATEPGTLLWYALRIDTQRFVIFDVFEDEAAVAAHFGGQAAAALKASAPDLIDGGWDQGVVAKVQKYTVLSATY
jgi:quinol monooxygenase YgiN